MPDAESVALVLEDIREHSAPLSSRQEAFVNRCEEELERDGDLAPNDVTTLYEILDDLDALAGTDGDSDSEWWEDDEEEEEDAVGSWDSSELWN